MIAAFELTLSNPARKIEGKHCVSAPMVHEAFPGKSVSVIGDIAVCSAVVTASISSFQPEVARSDAWLMLDWKAEFRDAFGRCKFWRYQTKKEL